MKITWNYRIFGLLITILIATVMTSTEVIVKGEVPPMMHGVHSTPLGCHMRLYTYKITQSDARGHECWDHVSVWSCWGRCDSREISDWKFPYKKSYHPVCVHAGRKKAMATLRHCHPSVEPETKRYQYMEATGCHCQTCTTTDTSCEAPNNIRDESSVKVLALAGVGPDDLDY